MTALAGMLSLNCGLSSNETGGLTAHLAFQDHDGSIIRQGLRTAAPPPEIDRLLITVLDVAGSTVASTQLSIDGTGDEMLDRQGGTWQVTNVPVAIDHTLVAQAFFGQRNADPGQRGRLAFQGIKKNVKVESGTTTNAGTILLKVAPSARIARFDKIAPQTFETMVINPIPQGNGLDINLVAPDDPDLAGVVFAISTSTTVTPRLLTRSSSISEGRALFTDDSQTIVRAI